MSKEQTPIDFESYIERMGYSWKDFDYSHQMEGLIEQYAQAKVLEDLEKDIQEIINAKVLEALEREFNKIPYIKHYNNGIVNTIGSKYYETEVKPKYK